MTTISLQAGSTTKSFPANSQTHKKPFKIKDPGSSLTHFIGMMAAMIGATPLLRKAATGPNHAYMSAFAIFILSMICLYAASTIYHTFDISESVNKVLRKIDHAMIFVLIAGSYTPICLIVLPKAIGIPLLTTVWIVAIVGTIFKICWITCPLQNLRSKCSGRSLRLGVRTRWAWIREISSPYPSCHVPQRNLRLPEKK